MGDAKSTLKKKKKTVAKAMQTVQPERSAHQADGAETSMKGVLYGATHHLKHLDKRAAIALQAQGGEEIAVTARTARHRAEIAWMISSANLAGVKAGIPPVQVIANTATAMAVLTTAGVLTGQINAGSDARAESNAIAVLR